MYTRMYADSWYIDRKIPRLRRWVASAYPNTTPPSPGVGIFRVTVLPPTTLQYIFYAIRYDNECKVCTSTYRIVDEIQPMVYDCWLPYYRGHIGLQSCVIRLKKGLKLNTWRMFESHYYLHFILIHIVTVTVRKKKRCFLLVT